jgi:hypothetical protein
LDLIHHRSHYFKKATMQAEFAGCCESMQSEFNLSKKLVVFIAADKDDAAANLKKLLRRSLAVLETQEGARVHVTSNSLDGEARQAAVIRAFADFFTIQACDALVMSEQSTWFRDQKK